MVTNDEQLVAYLRENELKVTPQRMLIIKYLLENRTHPTAEEIFDAVRNEKPTISYATVYKTLNKLVKIKFIQELNLGETPTRYDVNTGDHVNICCKICGRIWDYETPTVKDLLRELKSEVGGEFISQQIIMYQVCEDCLKKASE